MSPTAYMGSDGLGPCGAGDFHVEYCADARRDRWRDRFRLADPVVPGRTGGGAGGDAPSAAGKGSPSRRLALFCIRTYSAATTMTMTSRTARTIVALNSAGELEEEGVGVDESPCWAPVAGADDDNVDPLLSKTIVVGAGVGAT